MLESSVTDDELLLVNELDVIRRYLPSLERPKFSTRYSKFQVRCGVPSQPTTLDPQALPHTDTGEHSDGYLHTFS